MASRFFYGSGSDSDSSSDEEEEVYRSGSGSEEDSDQDDSDSGSSTDSDEEGDEGRTGASKFLHDDSESEESEEEEKVTVVKSAKDKRIEGIESTIRLIDNAEKINDWAVIATEFDNLNRQMLKVTGPTPKVYIQAVAELEDFTNETASKQKASNKKMNASNSKGFNAVKQKIKKNNKEYATLVEKYRADKDAFMADKVEEKPAPAPAPKPTKIEKIENFAAAAAAEDDGFATVGRGGKTLQYTPESILKHLRVIVESRGKKNTDRADQIRTMQKLIEVATTPYQRIRTYMTLISTRFDLTATSAATYMSSEQWQAANEEYSALLSVLEENRQFLVSEVADEWEDDEKQPTVAEGETFFIPGSVVSLVEHLDDSLTKGLREIDPHTSEYIERLTDEQALYSSLVRSQLYIESLKGADKNGQDSMNRLVIRRLEHIYFKPANVIAIVEQAKDKAVPTNIDDGIPRARAMLCQIYFLALHDQYYKSRDLMLMSHLTENIATFDVSTQILFNRTLVQIGLCAFRAGLIYEAQNTLGEICGSGRQKELLAQGIIMQRYSTVSPEQERLERQRQLPFHMHINLELLECVYLTSSALLEVPLMAQTSSTPSFAAA
ncbi:Winged helix-turn-helix transcription repressor DNA-binding [Penicillium expansum]|nr:Winged helix-turn-helix transcription repressor DNA-binding [Penicillium expansum]